MKTLFLSFVVAGAAALAARPACAQSTAPDFLTQPEARAPRAAKLPVDADRMRRQQQMSPEDAARDQQLQVMEARTGNTSFGMERGGPSRQPDKGNGGFTVRKFRQLRGQEEKRGESRRVPMGAHTTGQPLNHKKKHKFLFF